MSGLLAKSCDYCKLSVGHCRMPHPILMSVDNWFSKILGLLFDFLIYSQSGHLGGRGGSGENGKESRLSLEE